MYGLLTRFLPAWLSGIIMMLWIAACLVAIIWFWNVETQSFRYLEL